MPKMTLIEELMPCQDNRKSVRNIIKKYGEGTEDVKCRQFKQLSQVMVVKLILNWIEKNR